MRPRPLIGICFMLSTITYPAFAGKKVEFNATIRTDADCELGYRIVHTKKKGSTDEYCAIGPKAAVVDLARNVDKTVNVKGHDGTQTIDGNKILVMWVERVAGNKVQDYDPCHISTAYAILAGMNGQMPQLPPGCTGDSSSASTGGEPDQGASAAADPSETSSSPGQDQNSYATSEPGAQSAYPVPASTGAHLGSSSYVRGLSQCTRSEYGNGQLWVVNSCNVPVTVEYTSDSGNTWGQDNIGPNSRGLERTMGMGYDPRRDGRIYLFTCPTGTQPVGMPGVVVWFPHNYKGEYSCLQQ